MSSSSRRESSLRESSLRENSFRNDSSPSFALEVTTKKSTNYESASESSPFFADMKSGYLAASDESIPLVPGLDTEESTSFSCVEWLWSWIPTQCNLGCFKRVLTGDRFRIFCILMVMMVSVGFFLSTEETQELCQLDLIAVSTEYPWSMGLDSESKTYGVELAYDAPEPATIEYITSEIQGFNASSQLWTSCGDPWTVEIGPEILVESAENKLLFETQDCFDDFDSVRMEISTTSVIPIGLNIDLYQVGGAVASEVIIAALILVFVYILIIFELVHRTVAALIGSFVAISVLSLIRYRPSLEEIITWIDFETIGLLFGMMIMVGIFSTTGFFEWSAIKAYKLAKGDLWLLTTYLCLFTAVVSAFLDNVTTILLLTPVTIRLCRVLDVPATPMLLAEVMYSNLGGTATAIGDPPNIIIVNDRRIMQFDDEVNFGSFMIHVAPGVIISMVVVYFLVKKLVEPQIRRQPHQGLLQEIDIWEKSSKRVNPLLSDEDRHVYEMLQAHIASLKVQIDENQESDIAPIDISELEQKYCIRDFPLFITSCTVLGFVILFFFLHSAIQIDLSLSWIALIGAMIHLLVGNIHDVDHILEKVELGTLLFFAGLFVLMHALEEMGLIEFIATIVEDLIDKVDGDTAQLAVAVTLIVWVSALISAFIDNIPFTTTMVPVVVRLHTGELGLPLGPLVWALSMGACFGGNGTLIGASANVVCSGMAEQEGIHISFTEFFKIGFPVMLLSVLVAHCYLLFFHVWPIEWYDHDSAGA